MSGRPKRAVTLSTAVADVIKTHTVVLEMFSGFTTAVFVYVPLVLKYKAAEITFISSFRCNSDLQSLAA
jgi:hypothetical protein